jgi:hypothetical protein
VREGSLRLRRRSSRSASGAFVRFPARPRLTAARIVTTSSLCRSDTTAAAANVTARSRADSWEKAERLARDDPFQRQGLLHGRWLKSGRRTSAVPNWIVGSGLAVGFCHLRISLRFVAVLQIVNMPKRSAKCGRKPLVNPITIDNAFCVDKPACSGARGGRLLWGFGGSWVAWQSVPVHWSNH